jgi:hypothetical protein
MVRDKRETLEKKEIRERVFSNHKKKKINNGVNDFMMSSSIKIMFSFKNAIQRLGP